MEESEVSIGEVSAIDNEEEERKQRLEEDVEDAETMDAADKLKVSVRARPREGTREHDSFRVVSEIAAPAAVA